MKCSEMIQKIQQSRTLGQVADLSGIDLRVEHMQDLDLSEVNFSGANLSGTEFLACNLRKCSFHRANLSACKLADSDLSGADLSEIIFGGAELSNCKLVECNLSQADLSGCNFQSSDLTGVNLVKAVLNSVSGSATTLHGARAAKASLRQMNLNECDLSEADLSGVSLFAARLHGSKLIKCILCRADLRECDLQASDLSGANMSRANLEGARLSDTNLTATNLSGANLINADVTLADMSGADLRDADLTDAHFRNSGQPVLRGALYNDGTEWSEELDGVMREQAARTEIPISRSLSSITYRPAPTDFSMPRPGGWLGILAPMLKLLSLETSPQFTLPDTNVTAEEREIGIRAYHLLVEVNEALKHNQRIVREKKASLKQQARQALDNIVALLWKLSRIRRAKAVVRPQSQIQIEDLEERLLIEITRSSDVLEDVLMSTMQLEIKGGDKTIDRLLENLSESNKRMRDLADAYDEIKSEKS